MSPILLRIFPAAVIVFWAFRIFFKKDVLNMQLLMVLGMLMSVMTLFIGEDTALFMFPFFFLSIVGMTSANGISKWYWLLLLPSILFIPFKETLAFSVFLMFQAVFLSVWSVIRVRRFNSLLSEYYDNGSDLSDDLNQIVMLLIATIVVIVVMMILPEDVISIPWVAVSFSLFISVLQFLLGNTVYNLKEMPQITDEMEVSDLIMPSCEPDDKVSTIEVGEDSSVASAETHTNPVNSDQLLLQRVISEKLYLNSLVSLVSLADELHTNRTYLSNSIHSCYNQNFSDFINTLRIKHSLELMKAGGDDVNIKDVAINSGYNHIQSFYRNFALIMEMTPKAWLSKQSQQK